MARLLSGWAYLFRSPANIHTSLSAGQTNLGVIENEMTKISATVKGISSDLSSAQKSTDQYQTVTTKLKTRVEATQLAIPDLMTTLAWILSILLGWIMISQLGLLVQGFDLLQGRRLA